MDVAHRPHRTPQAGTKYEKKKKRDHQKKQAFGFNSAARASKSQRRNLDIGVKRQHLPVASHVLQPSSLLPNTTATGTTTSSASLVDPPPFLIVVVGPPRTGKSSIISSLVKHYTGHSIPLTSIKGPVTILTSSTRRITLIECPQSLHSMIDMGKTADLVLLTVDASFGFEMETFEFLNILKQHGFPRVMGVLTHLDQFRSTKQVNQVKKKMKHRFWTEICDGAKLFYLSGMIHGRYLKREILNLARFISVMKFRPLQWRSSHAYLVADRMEDLTDPNEVAANSLCERRIALYGYVRGTLMQPTAMFHFLGVGDYTPTSFTVLDDPVPIKHKNRDGEGDKAKIRRKLNEKEKRLYAPMSDIGDVVYDEDVVYIQMKDKHVHYSKDEMIIRGEGDEDESQRAQRQQLEAAEEAGGEGVRMVKQLQDVTITIDDKMKHSGLQLFKGSTAILDTDIRGTQRLDSAADESDHEDEDEEMTALRQREAIDAAQRPQERIFSRSVVDRSGRMRRKVLFDGEEDQIEVSHEDDDLPDAAYEVAEDEEDEAMELDEDHLDDENDEYSEDHRNGHMRNMNGRAANGHSLLPIHPSTDTPAVRRKILEKDSLLPSFQNGDDDEEEEEEEVGENEEEVEEEDEDEQENVQVDEDEEEEEEESVDEDDASQARSVGSHRGVNRVNNGEDEKKSAVDLTDNRLKSIDAQHSLKWKESIIDRAALNHRKSLNLMELVYGGADQSAKNNSNYHHEEKQQQWKQRISKNKLTLLDDDSDDEHNNGNSAKIEEEKKDDEEEEEEFFKVRLPSSTSVDDDDSLKLSLLRSCDNKDWNNPEVYESIRNRFVTGDWSEERGNGDFEQEEEMQSEEEEEEKKRKRKARKGRRGQSQTTANGQPRSDELIDDDNEMEDDEEDDGITVSGAADVLAGETEEEAAERRRRVKESLKYSFNVDYDKGKNPDETDQEESEAKVKPISDDAAAADDDDSHYKQLQATHAAQVGLNATAFADLDVATRLQLEGARPGSYVRVEFVGVPCEFVQHFSPSNPLIIGALLHHESSLGYVSIRLKRHRWHKKILKSFDPLIFSIGWRRFQSCPIYAIEDNNQRLRYLKYTPEHMHCIAVTYAPFTTLNAGVVAYQYTENHAAFRIAATGVVIEMDAGKINENQVVVKKLKLIGHPYKIYKHTAYIKDMFNSRLEVNKFINVKISTVSGIRGAIKKAITTEGHDGVFRATFEDKILTSDIIICKSWSRVEPLNYYLSIASLLFANQQWKGMRTIRQIRSEDQIPIPINQDSLYQSIERPMKQFNPFIIPKKLISALPFPLQPKLPSKRASNHQLYQHQRISMIRDQHEKQMYSLMQQVRTIKNMKQQKRAILKQKHAELYRKKQSKEQEKHQEQNREMRKRKYIAESQGRVVKSKRYTDK